jgi:hypothetical protein
MAEEKHHHNHGARGAGMAGGFWFAGWLFTWAFCSLAWWKVLLGIIIWPYFLGLAIR